MQKKHQETSTWVENGAPGAGSNWWLGRNQFQPAGEGWLKTPRFEYLVINDLSTTCSEGLNVHVTRDRISKQLRFWLKTTMEFFILLIGFPASAATSLVRHKSVRLHHFATWSHPAWITRTWCLKPWKGCWMDRDWNTATNANISRVQSGPNRSKRLTEDPNGQGHPP